MERDEPNPQENRGELDPEAIPRELLVPEIFNPRAESPNYLPVLEDNQQPLTEMQYLIKAENRERIGGDPGQGEQQEDYSGDGNIHPSLHHPIGGRIYPFDVFRRSLTKACCTISRGTLHITQIFKEAMQGPVRPRTLERYQLRVAPEVPTGVGEIEGFSTLHSFDNQPYLFLNRRPEIHYIGGAYPLTEIICYGRDLNFQYNREKIFVANSSNQCTCGNLEFDSPNAKAVFDGEHVNTNHQIYNTLGFKFSGYLHIGPEESRSCCHTAPYKITVTHHFNQNPWMGEAPNLFLLQCRGSATMEVLEKVRGNEAEYFLKLYNRSELEKVITEFDLEPEKKNDLIGQAVNVLDVLSTSVFQTAGLVIPRANKSPLAIVLTPALIAELVIRALLRQNHVTYELPEDE